MFSFGGFSSIVPYIGYLMVMWACILVGLSGQTNKILAILLHSDNSAEIRIEEKNYSGEHCYLMVSDVQPNKKNNLFAESFFSEFRNTETISQAFLKECINLPPDPYPDIRGLRAPPCA